MLLPKRVKYRRQQQEKSGKFRAIVVPAAHRQKV